MSCLNALLHKAIDLRARLGFLQEEKSSTGQQLVIMNALDLFSSAASDKVSAVSVTIHFLLSTAL